MAQKNNKPRNPALRKTAVSSSAIGEPHDKWLTKFNKRKEGQLFNLKFRYKELDMPPYDKGRPNKYNFCANALWIAIKGTKMEEDGKFFVELLDPNFFAELE